MVAQTTHTHTNNDSTYTNNDIANKRIAKYYSSQVAEQIPKRETLEVFCFGSNSVNVNLPPVFIQALQITASDEVTAELITTPDGRKGILIFKDIKNKAVGNFQEANNQDYDG